VRLIDRISGLPMIVLVGVMTVVPIGLLVLNSFNVARPGRPSHYGLENWRQAFASHELGSAILNTLKLGVTRTAIALVIATALAVLIARTDMPGRRLVEVALWFGFFIPPLSMTLGWILLLDPSSGVVNTTLRSVLGLHGALGPLDIYGFWGIILAHISSSTVPLMTILMVAPMRRMSSSLEEAARSCGAGTLRTIWSVTLPMMRPAILGATLLSFIYSLKAFEIEYLLGNPVGFKVFSTQIYDWVYRDPPLYGVATALGILIVPVMIVLAIGQRFATRGGNYVTVSARGFADSPVRLGRIRRWVVAGGAYLYVLLIIALPVAALVVGSFMRRFGFFHIVHPYSTQHWSALFHDSLFTHSWQNSIKLGLGATIVGVIVYFLIAWVAVRSKMPGRGLVDVMAWLPVALPGILLGLGLMWAFLGTPAKSLLYGSTLGLIIAVVINHMATGTQQMKAGVLQISAEHEQAARSCGARPWRTLWSVTLPLIGPTVAGVAVLSFDAAIRDISSTVLLSSDKSRPLSVLLFEYSATSQLEEAAALGVIMSIATVIVGLISTRMVGGRLGRTTTPRRRRRRAINAARRATAAATARATASAPPS
jgi:iron(III) transport system permease protein